MTGCSENTGDGIGASADVVTVAGVLKIRLSGARFAALPSGSSAYIGLHYGAGLISYVVLKAVRGKAREIHPLLWAVAALFLLYFLRGELERLLF